ncbi:hypothetical protein ARC20_00450 [Stenotrophomonas panacihumi]|uniref:Uncharacterized protein n=1 Tax=Stenotrophomonas panacihumi TaxID=676599 RepID=A0A0R0ARP8_9GAMM|nr:hypothetical protein [Stenotrophomonas panacihumi]KRG45122.1 hypothetical protein ARC20_00450 [Stenotrophomonas panacihumi]PTN55525.1 hypothetical protein C9J98_04915 [Stenotrophomonas panacihumi]
MFDAHARDLHQAALGALDPATLARLRAARHDATQAAPGRRHRGLWLATACTALLALGLGVHLNLPSPSHTSVSPASSLVASVDADEVLEQNPDLYVWLGSENALAMEQTR